MKLGILIGLITAFSILHPKSATAGLSLCNQSFDVLNIAIAEPQGEQGRSAGWWRVAPNQCATLIREDLTKRFYYVFAADVFGNVALSGTMPFCVGTRRFDIEGQENCLVRGHLDANFAEIDTQEQKHWVVFVSGKPES